jgi:hypothetical protein
MFLRLCSAEERNRDRNAANNERKHGFRDGTHDGLRGRVSDILQVLGSIHLDDAANRYEENTIP